jgi:hypothetical protein
MTCHVNLPKAHESKTNSGLMVVLDRHIPINGISCRERGNAVRIDRIVVGTKTGNVLHFLTREILVWKFDSYSLHSIDWVQYVINFGVSKKLGILIWFWIFFLVVSLPFWVVLLGF